MIHFPFDIFTSKAPLQLQKTTLCMCVCVVKCKENHLLDTASIKVEMTNSVKKKSHS